MSGDPFSPILERHGAVVLDGGMGTELEARGADLRDPLWSAKVLVEDPERIREARAAWWHERERGDRSFPLVAASIGPYGAVLGNGAEFTGDYDKGVDELVAFHVPRLEALAAAEPDVLACETIPSIAEAEALVRALERVPGVPAWLSFSCRNAGQLCDGTPFEEAIRVVEASPSMVAVGVNCTAPTHIDGLVRIARTTGSRSWRTRTEARSGMWGARCGSIRPRRTPARRSAPPRGGTPALGSSAGAAASGRRRSRRSLRLSVAPPEPHPAGTEGRANEGADSALQIITMPTVTPTAAPANSVLGPRWR